MRNLKPTGYFPLGLLLFSFMLALFKAASLSVEITGSFSLLALLLSLDLSFLSLLALLAVAHGFSLKTLIRIPLKVLFSLAVIFYIVHTFVLLELDEYMNLFDLGRYLPEWRVVGSFFNAMSISALLVFVFAMFYNRPISSRTLVMTAGVALAILVSGLVTEKYSPIQLQKYGLLRINAFTEQMLNRQPASAYSSQQIDFFASIRPPAVEFIQADPDIILLIVESLSSINSYKVSGERNLLPSFDLLNVLNIFEFPSHRLIHFRKAF